MTPTLTRADTLRLPTCRLRQVDVKAEHFERQVQRAEQERDEWEKKHGVSGRGGVIKRETGGRTRCLLVILFGLDIPCAPGLANSDRLVTACSDSDDIIIITERFADAFHPTPQEAVEKYQQSKRELDEVVAQMESLVSDVRSAGECELS